MLKTNIVCPSRKRDHESCRRKDIYIVHTYKTSSGKIWVPFLYAATAMFIKIDMILLYACV